MRQFALLSAFFLAARLLYASPGMRVQDVNPNDQIPLRSAHLPGTARNEIAAVIIKDLLDTLGFDLTDTDARQIALGSWVSFVNLSNRGAKIAQISGGPGNPSNGATGNTSLWLFRLQGGHATLILSGGASVSGPSSKAYHHGMLDYQTRWNMGGCCGDFEVYRFDGVRYRPLFCYELQTDEAGNEKRYDTECSDQ